MSFHLIEALTQSQLLDLHALYEKEWWTQGRSFDDVRIMIENSSMIVGFVDNKGKLAAFCRILTDFVFRATIYDVIVAEAFRGRGLGRKLMDVVSQHPRLQRVNTIWLCCLPEMVPFYEKWGFEVCDTGLQWMFKGQRSESSHRA